MSALNPAISVKKDKIRLCLLVQPNASRSEVVGLHGEFIKIRIKAPPVDGKANQEIIKFLAVILKLKASQIEIEKGLTGRRKIVYLEGVSLEFAIKCLGFAKIIFLVSLLF